MRRGRVMAVALGMLVSACSSEPNLVHLRNPFFSPDKGVVVLFAGWTMPGGNVFGSGMDEVTQELRARGVRAFVYNPNRWQDVAAEIGAVPSAARGPIAIIGYSFGGDSATRLADALRQSRIPVQTLLVVEAWGAIPIACNVRGAIDIFNSNSLIALSSRIVPGPGFSGSFEQVNYGALTDNRDGLNHWTMATFGAVHRIVLDKILDGDALRRRPAPPGEAACIGEAAPSHPR